MLNFHISVWLILISHRSANHVNFLEDVCHISLPLFIGAMELQTCIFLPVKHKVTDRHEIINVLRYVFFSEIILIHY
jgi:hypothetical protein